MPEPLDDAASGPGAAPGDGAAETRSLEDILLAEEVALGEGGPARNVNDALRSLARAARSFLLYDPGNEAIRTFLERYEADVRTALAVVGDQLSLVVRPFELVWEGEVVYLERDRERSLAFRLFRDGVRRLTIQRDVAWDEMLTLLQILSIRYTGVRQQEEDIVTLLWKAGFKGIDIVAVEGFEAAAAGDDDEVTSAPAGVGGRDREDEDDLDEARLLEIFGTVPTDFDLPIPSPLPPGDLAWRPLAPEELEPLAVEASSRALPHLCVRLVHEVLVLVADPVDPTSWEDVEHLVLEIRDFLLAEGQLDNLLAVVREIDATRVAGEARVERFLKGFVDTRAMGRIAHSVPASHTELPPELVELLDLIPGYHLLHAMEALERERSASARRITRQLVERYVGQDPDMAIDRIGSADPGVAADLVRALSQALPERADEIADRAIARGDSESLFEVLHAVTRSLGADWVPTMLTRLLESGVEEVRVRAMERLAELGPRRTYPILKETLQRRCRSGISPAEAEAYGRTMVAVAPDDAIPWFTELVRPSSLLKRIFHDPIGHGHLQWAAVSGLAEVPGEEIDQTIRWLADRAGEDLSRYCLRVLARRRHGVAHGS